MWLDQLDIEPGTPWDIAIEEALTLSPRMLVILSPVSVSSENVRDEVTFALSARKRVIPVLYRDCNLPLRLARLQHIDFRTDYVSGLKVLMKFLGIEQQVAPSVVPGPIPTTPDMDSSGAEQITNVRQDQPQIARIVGEWVGQISGRSARLSIRAISTEIQSSYDGELEYDTNNKMRVIESVIATVNDSRVLLKGTGYRVLAGSGRFSLDTLDGRLSSDGRLIEGAQYDDFGNRQSFVLTKSDAS